MPMVAAESLVRDHVQIGKEVPMSACVATNDHSSRNMRSWRTFVFGGIGALYLVSLLVPAVREALAQVFAYFPR
jgi:hypothetical protein